ncbi:MAG: hypothetical protein HKO83_07795 [Ignavibacteriaceae bacterium]|nr:hypothetical protein [Ignavibacteriaceae bacterium]
MKLVFITPLLIIILITFTDCSTSQEQTRETDPVNITAQAVFNRYIAAIGGKEAFENVKDKITVMSGTAAEQPIKIMIIQKYPDKLFQELTAGEMKQTIIYNGNEGLMFAGDEQIKIEDEELERLKFDAALHLPLDPESYGVKTELESNVEVDSIICFKVTFNLPSGLKWYQYYASDSGLKIKEIKEIKTAQGVFKQESYYTNYKEVKGLKFPHTIKQYFGIQELDLEVTSIEINSGIDSDIFNIGN